MQYLYNIFFVGIGGLLGSISRYLLSTYIANLFKHHLFPYGTLTVNVVGCFFIGFLGAACKHHFIFSPQVRLFLLMGFLGGFTTFSSFGYEAFTLAKDNQMMTALLDVVLQSSLGLCAVWLGFYMGLEI